MAHRLFLHIGIEKTGTKSIQNFLAKHRELIQQKFNIRTINSWGETNHQLLTLVAAPDSIRTRRIRMKFGLLDKYQMTKYIDQCKIQLGKELSEHKSKAYVISSEHLSSRLYSVEEIQRLIDYLSINFDDIKVVIYLRSQEKLIPSHLSTAIKVGNCFDLKELKFDHWFDYDQILTKWGEVVGQKNIITRIFDHASLKNESLLHDFCESVGIVLSEVTGVIERKNKALGIKGMAFLEGFNKYFPSIVNDQLNPLRADIARLIMQFESQGNNYIPFQFGLQKVTEIREKYAPGNANVASTYFGDPENGLFLLDPIDRIPASDSILSLSTDEIQEMIAYIWLRKQSEIQMLQNKLSSIE